MLGKAVRGPLLAWLVISAMLMTLSLAFQLPAQPAPKEVDRMTPIAEDVADDLQFPPYNPKQGVWPRKPIPPASSVYGTIPDYVPGVQPPIPDAPLPPVQNSRAISVPQPGRMARYRIKPPTRLPDVVAAKASVGADLNKGSWWTNWKAPWSRTPAGSTAVTPLPGSLNDARQIGKLLETRPINAAQQPVKVTPITIKNGKGFYNVVRLPGNAMDAQVIHDMAGRGKPFFVQTGGKDIFRAVKTGEGWIVAQPTALDIKDLNLRNHFKASQVQAVAGTTTSSVAQAAARSRPTSWLGKAKGFFGGATTNMFGKWSKWLRPAF